MTNGGAASILAHDSVLRRMSAPTGKASPYPADAWPTEAFYPKRNALRMNDEGIEVLYQPAAHSDADSFVLFRGSDVVVAGDIMDTTRFPVIDIANGGSIQGEIDALNKLIELTIAPTPYIYKERRDVRDSRSRAALRADGSGGLPRHGGADPRRDRGHDQAGKDARSNSRSSPGSAL